MFLACYPLTCSALFYGNWDLAVEGMCLLGCYVATSFCRMAPSAATFARKRNIAHRMQELKPNASVGLHRHSNACVAILPPETDSSIQLMSAQEKPDVSYLDIGGLDMQKQVFVYVRGPLPSGNIYASSFSSSLLQRKGGMFSKFFLYHPCRK